MTRHHGQTAVVGPAGAARRLGVSIKALRIYERRGLVRPRRTLRGWRQYTPMDIERLSQALVFKAMGFALSQIAGLLNAPPAEVAVALTAQERQLVRWQTELDDALAALRNARKRLGASRLRLVA